MLSDEEAVVGICGIYCGSCPSYLAPRVGDAEQIRLIAERHGIPEAQVPCDGCHSGRVMKTCLECVHGF